MVGMSDLLDPRAITGTAAGVPYVLIPPDTARDDAPVVVVWHLHDAPRSETAMAAAVPLRGLDAWRVYLGMPVTGSRLPDGRLEAFYELGAQDAVRLVFRASIVGALEELPGALAALRAEHGIGTGPLGIMGGSAGAATAQLVLAESDQPVSVAVLISPVVQLKPLVTEIGQHYGIEYPWDDETLEFARRLDVVARADDLASRLPQPAVLVVTGGQDSPVSILNPADELVAALKARYEDPERVRAIRLPEMAHALAEDPGLEPAPQTADAAAVDEAAAAWFAAQFALGSV
jgi:pimeloyl-ACP methyl ester carboxylesterase